MKIKIVSLFGLLFGAITAYGQFTVKAIVESGDSTLAYGAEPAKFATLDNIDVYTPATKAGVTRAYYGLEVTFPQDVSINIAQFIAKLRKDGVDYQSFAVQKYAAPGATAFPYVIVYNAAGLQTSIDFSNVVGTTVVGKRLVIGALRWKFGSNFPLEQPLLSMSYVESWVLNGTYQVGASTPIAFDIRPGDPSQSTESVKYAYAAIGVSPEMSKDDWFAQLLPGPSSTSEGSFTQPVVDPSGLVNTPGGYRFLKWQTSVDLLNWEPTGNAVVSGNTVTFSGMMADPKRFFRVSKDLAFPSNVTWWN